MMKLPQVVYVILAITGQEHLQIVLSMTVIKLERHAKRQGLTNACHVKVTHSRLQGSTHHLASEIPVMVSTVMPKTARLVVVSAQAVLSAVMICVQVAKRLLN